MDKWWQGKFFLKDADDFDFVEYLEARPVTHYILKAKYQKPIEISEVEYATLKEAMDAAKKPV